MVGRWMGRDVEILRGGVASDSERRQEVNKKKHPQKTAMAWTIVYLCSMTDSIHPRVLGQVWTFHQAASKMRVFTAIPVSTLITSKVKGNKHHRC